MAAFVVPLAIAGISALSSYLKSRSDKAAAEKGTQTNQTTNQDMWTTNSSKSQGSSTPTYDPLQLQGRDAVLRGMMYRADPYQVGKEVDAQVAQNASNINSGADAMRRIIGSNISARGLNYSPVAATATLPYEQSRIQQQVANANSRSALYDQMMGSRIKDAGTFISSLPTGTQTTNSSDLTTHNFGQTQTVGTNVGAYPGSAAGDVGGNLATTLAWLYGNGAFQPKAPSGGST